MNSYTLIRPWWNLIQIQRKVGGALPLTVSQSVKFKTELNRLTDGMVQLSDGTPPLAVMKQKRASEWPVWVGGKWTNKIIGVPSGVSLKSTNNLWIFGPKILPTQAQAALSAVAKYATQDADAWAYIK